MKPLISSLLIFLFSGSVFSQVQPYQSEKLIRAWDTPKVLQTPESVFYDPVLQIYFVSNINGKPTDKDGNGYISIISADGKITDLQWMTGLDAPKGMGMYKGVLYVADIDRVVAIDVINRVIKKIYNVPEAKFLNDIAIDKYGSVYISDTGTNRIYRIYNDKVGIWLDDKLLTSPNGLFIETDNLLIGCQKIVIVSLKDKSLTVWLDNTGAIDGLKGLGDGRYIFSDWSGHVFLADKDKKVEKLLDTTPSNINAADIEFVPGKQLLLVPTFGDNRVMAYELK
jgi:hypothetical protein